MSSFRTAIMTNAGAELLAQSIAEGFRVEFVKMVTGSGVYEESEKTDAELQARTEVKNKQQESGFSSITASEEHAVLLKALISNQSLDAGYRMTEIGIIAKREGEENTEILYSIAIAEEADYLPSKENPIEITQEYYTMVSNAENVYINVKMGAYALAEDVYNLSYPAYDEAEVLAELESGESIFDLFGKSKKAVKELIAHIRDRNNPHEVTKSQIGLNNVDNTADADKPVSYPQQNALDTYYQQSTGYTDQAIADLINGAPETLNTLKEVADAIKENETVVEALDGAIGKKANQAELDTHTENATIHITSAERTKWNNKLDAAGDSKNNTVTFTSGDSTAPTAWTDVSALASSEKHSSIFNKISTMFKNVRWLYKMLGTTDISALGNGTVTGALSALNTNLATHQSSGDHDGRYYTKSEADSLIRHGTFGNDIADGNTEYVQPSKYSQGIAIIHFTANGYRNLIALAWAFTNEAAGSSNTLTEIARVGTNAHLMYVYAWGGSICLENKSSSYGVSYPFTGVSVTFIN